MIHNPSSVQQEVILLSNILKAIEEGNVLTNAGNYLLASILDEQNEQTALLRQIADGLAPVPTNVISFTVTQEPPMLSISPGNSPVYTATPQPDGVQLVNGVPTWTSSDSVNAPVSADATGLVATVAIPSTATVGTVFTLTVSYTNADGVVATGTIDQTIVAAVTDVTGFTIAQTA